MLDMLRADFEHSHQGRNDPGEAYLAGGCEPSTVVAIENARYSPVPRACQPRRSTLRTLCVTMSYMKGTLTIRLDEELERELDRLTQETGRTRSDLARDALRRQLAVLRFEQLRGKVLPLAEAQGLLTDEDVFSEIS